jgi:UDP-N-acetylglucosamine acyltransferase
VGAFTIAVGNPARIAGINTVGLTRRGCDENAIAALEAHLKDQGEIPAELPEEIVAVLTAWANRPSRES